MKLAVVETPYKGNIKLNTAYARACMMETFRMGYAPFLSHLIFPQCLDDDIPHERALGIEAGLCWGQKADVTIVFTDLGISVGMQMGIDRALQEGRTVLYHSLGVLKTSQLINEYPQTDVEK